MPPTSFKVAGVQGLPFTISARIGGHPGPARERLGRETTPAHWTRFPPASPSCPAKRRQHFLGVPRQQVHVGGVLALDQFGMYHLHESGEARPIIHLDGCIPKKGEKLHFKTIAISQKQRESSTHISDGKFLIVSVVGATCSPETGLSATPFERQVASFPKSPLFGNGPSRTKTTHAPRRTAGGPASSVSSSPRWAWKPLLETSPGR